MEKTSSLHPQNKKIKKSRQALLRGVRDFNAATHSKSTNLIVLVSTYSQELAQLVTSFTYSTYVAITASRSLQNVAIEARLFLKAFIADGVRYSRGLFIFFGVDALIIDDEPL
jgi:hypothetical protein